MSLHNSTASLNDFRAKTANGGLAKEDTASDVTVTAPKCRNYLTFCIYASFMALGMAASVGGPTFVHMTYVLDTDIQTLATSFTTGSLGYLLGSLFCGALADRFNSELQFTVTTFSIGFCVISCPWAPNIYAYLAIDAMRAFSMATWTRSASRTSSTCGRATA